MFTVEIARALTEEKLDRILEDYTRKAIFDKENSVSFLVFEKDPWFSNIENRLCERGFMNISVEPGDGYKRVFFSW